MLKRLQIKISRPAPMPAAGPAPLPAAGPTPLSAAGPAPPAAGLPPLAAGPTPLPAAGGYDEEYNTAALSIAEYIAAPCEIACGRVCDNPDVFAA